MLSTYALTEESLRIDPVQEVLAQHRGETADIVQASGLQPDQGRALLERPIELFVAYVSRLPATRDTYYCAPTGLLRLGLDCALLAARKAQVWEFSGLGHIERRRIEAPRWRVACILAALLGDLHRVVTQFAVWGESERWSPLVEPLSRFGERQVDRRVRLEWRKGGARVDDERSWNLPLANKIIDDSILDFLNEGDPQIVADFFAVLSGEAVHRPANVIRPLVEDARARLIARDHLSTSRPSPEPPEAAEQRPESHPREQHATKALDYPSELFVKEIQRLLLRPRACKGRIGLEPDGRLGIRRDWMKSLGFSPAQLEARLIAAGWADISSTSDQQAIFLSRSASGELLKDIDCGGLLSSPPAPA